MHTRSVAAEVGRFLVKRGATLTAHAAAGLGLVDRLADLLAGAGRLDLRLQADV